MMAFASTITFKQKHCNIWSITVN